MAENQKFRFVSKPTAKDGKASIIIAVLSAAVMLAAIMISFANGGQAEVVIGAMGLCAIGLAIYSFLLGIFGLNEKNVDHKLSFIGTIAGGLAAILYLAVFFVGVK